MTAHPEGQRRVVIRGMYLHYLLAGLGRPVLLSQCVFSLKNFTKEKLKDTFFFGKKKIKKKILWCVTRWRPQVRPWAAFQCQTTWLEASGGTGLSAAPAPHSAGTAHVWENCSCGYCWGVVPFWVAGSCGSCCAVARPVCYTGGCTTSTYCLKNRAGCVSVSHRNRRAGFPCPHKGPELSSELTSSRRNGISKFAESYRKHGSLSLPKYKADMFF